MVAPGGDAVSYGAMIVGGGGVSPLLAVQVSWTNRGAFTSTGWGNVTLLRMGGWRAAREAFGWLQDNNANGETRYSSTFYAVGDTISWRDSGAHPVSSGCWHSGGILIPVKPV